MLWLLIHISFSLSPQDAPTKTPLALSPDAAVQRALAKNIQHKALINKAKEASIQAEKWIELENPELRLGDFRSDRLLNPLFDGSGWNAPLEDTRFGLRWKPPALKEFGFAQKARSFRKKRFLANLLSGEKALEHRVRILHAELRNLKRRIALADEAVLLAQRMQKMIQQRLAAHAATKLELAVSNLDFLDEVAAREKLKSRYRAEISLLREILVLPLETKISLLSPQKPNCGPIQISQQQQEEFAAQHPQIQALDASIREIDTEIFITQLAFSPWFDFFQLAYVTGGRNAPSSLRFRLSITVPIFEQQREDAAKLRERRQWLKLSRSASAHHLKSKLKKSLEELHSQVEMMHIYEINAQNVLGASQKTLEQAFIRKNADLLNVSLVKNRILRARRGEIRVYLECEKAALYVQMLSGTITNTPLTPPWKRYSALRDD